MIAYMLVVSNTEEDVMSFYHTKSDLVEALADRLAEVDRDIDLDFEGLTVEQAVRLANKRTELDVAWEEIEIEGRAKPELRLVMEEVCANGTS